MSDEELQRRRAARLREQIDQIKQEAAPKEVKPEADVKPGPDERESAENRRKAPSSPMSPREFIHRRMRELDAEDGSSS